MKSSTVNISFNDDLLSQGCKAVAATMRMVLDTNVLVSALLFGGLLTLRVFRSIPIVTPRQYLDL